MSISDAVLVHDDGTLAAYAGPSLREGLPPYVLEGLARRRLVALGQTCPCGARLIVPNRETRRAARRRGQVVMPVEVEHEPDCAAVCAELQTGRWCR